jgi:hypothetical protein
MRVRWDVPWPKGSGNFSWDFGLGTGSLSAGESWSSPPIIGFPYREMLLKVYSTQDATAYIDVPDKLRRLAWVDPDFTWVQHDYFPIPAGRA